MRVRRPTVVAATVGLVALGAVACEGSADENVQEDLEEGGEELEEEIEDN